VDIIGKNRLELAGRGTMIAVIVLAAGFGGWL